eukprot:1533836-Amphidinium_carterae.1
MNLPCKVQSSKARAVAREHAAKFLQRKADSVVAMKTHAQQQGACRKFNSFCCFKPSMEPLIFSWQRAL